MGVRRHIVSLTSAADGSGTGYTPKISGTIRAIHYIKDGGANPYANGVDFAITAETTGEGIWTESDVNASKACYPRAGTHSTVGVASLYAAAGTAVNDAIRLGNDRVKIVLAQAGNAKVGAFHIVVED